MRKLQRAEAGIYYFNTAENRYMIERCESMYASGVWWLLKRTGDSFGEIIHETNTLGEMRIAIDVTDKEIDSWH